MERDPVLIRSSYSGPVTRQAVTVRLEIYRLERDTTWVLEVVNQNGTSTLWDELFPTDSAAYEAFEATVEQEGMTAFLDKEEPQATPTPH